MKFSEMLQKVKTKCITREYTYIDPRAPPEAPMACFNGWLLLNVTGKEPKKIFTSLTRSEDSYGWIERNLRKYIKGHKKDFKQIPSDYELHDMVTDLNTQHQIFMRMGNAVERNKIHRQVIKLLKSKGL